MTPHHAGLRFVRATSLFCRRHRLARAVAWAVVGGSVAPGVWAQAAPPSAPAEAASAVASVPMAPPSALDAPLFYQLLIGEMEAHAGNANTAYEVVLDAARRSKDGALFQRAVELAVQARSGDKALQAARAWIAASPDSTDALRTQAQLMVALNLADDLPDPLRRLLERTPVADRAATLAGLPRFLGGLADKHQALLVAEKVVAPFINAEATRTASRTALGRLALADGQTEKALALARRAAEDEPGAPGPALLAMEMMADQPEAEALVRQHLAQPQASNALRLTYARALQQQQRYAESVVVLRAVLAQEPEQAQAWLSLGMLLVDLRESREAVSALERFVALRSARSSAGRSDDRDEEAANAAQADDLAAYLLSQAWEQLGQMAQAQQWINRVPTDRVDMSVLQQRAELLVRQGKLAQARALVRDTPVRGEADARTRLLAEAHVLREAKQWREAYDLLLAGLRAQPEDSVFIYELAMVAERMARYEDMEVLLRRVIALKPDDAQAYNALGYSLAERNVRLDEARELIVRAVSLAPRDPFIVDSLGWVEYRLGRRDEALKLLRQSMAARPHAEVASHLGEVLWISGQRDEALRIWRDGRAREADNEVLRATLARLKVKL